MVMFANTIVAKASPSGRASISVVRISGAKALDMARIILGYTPKIRQAHYGDFFDASGEMIDKGIAIFYKAPYSFTGEDILELQAHGSLVVTDSLIETALNLGAVLAEAGEFSKRAFLNGKIDLIQAEAIADLIAASTRQSMKSALRSLTGKFSSQINILVKSINELRIFVEASIDFSDEDIDLKGRNTLKNKLVNIKVQLDKILKNAQAGSVLRQGLHIAIVGKPNVGKSSLLNALTKTDSAIVTNLAGTTRDTLKETVHLGGVPIYLADTAGIHRSENIIEKEGIKRAQKAMRAADLILLVFTADSTPDFSILPDVAHLTQTLLVKNKIDTIDKKAGIVRKLIHNKNEITTITISAKYHLGIDALSTEILKLTHVNDLGEHTILARKRHIESLKSARKYIIHAEKNICLNEFFAEEFFAEDLRLCANALGEITGKTTSDDLLGDIFANFCIGK